MSLLSLFYKTVLYCKPMSILMYSLSEFYAPIITNNVCKILHSYIKIFSHLAFASRN